MATPVNNQVVLSTYGESEEIFAFAKRVKVMVPGGNKLSDSEAQALAQVSYVTGLNPFIGEVWYIPGRGPMVGIKGARRCGNEEISKAGGPDAYWFADTQPCSPQEAGAPDGENVAAAYKSVITDSVSTAKYQKMLIETISAMREAGSPDPVGEAKQIIGKKPEWIGCGYSTVSEQSKMNKQALAMKRAEADALKRKFSIPFGADVAAGENAVDAGAWVEAQAADVTDIAPHPMTIEEARQMIVKVAGKDKFIGELDATQLNHIIENSLFMDKVRAAELVLKEDFRMDPPQPENKSVEQLQKELGF